MSIYQRVGFINIMALTTSGIMGMMFKMFKFQDFSAVQKRKKNGDLKMSYKKKTKYQLQYGDQWSYHSINGAY